MLGFLAAPAIGRRDVSLGVVLSAVKRRERLLSFALFALFALRQRFTATFESDTLPRARKQTHHARRSVNDGRKNVPFALPDDDEQDVFSSVDLPRSEGVPPQPTYSTASGMPAVQPEPQAAPAPVVTKPRTTGGGLKAVRTPRLVVEAANIASTRTVEVDRPLYLIGRDGADLPLADDYVSRWHAQLRVQDGTLVLEDLGSQNGVYLRIADEMQLEDYDEIVTGHQRFIFRRTWDTARPPHKSPFAVHTPIQGAAVPADATRLVQIYAGGIVGGVWRMKDSLVIGRQNADVTEPDDPWLSTPHAVIERRADTFFIKDARSQYGTFIRLLESVELIDGDCFVVGRTRIKVEYP